MRAAPTFYVFNNFLGGNYYWGRLLCVLRPGAHIFWACGTILVELFGGFGVVEKQLDQNNDVDDF